MHDIVIGLFVNRYAFGRAVCTSAPPLLQHYRYQYVRDQVQYARRMRWEKQEKTSKRSKVLDNCGHIEGVS